VNVLATGAKSPDISRFVELLILIYLLGTDILPERLPRGLELHIMRSFESGWHITMAGLTFLFARIRHSF
jgi:hypothetical protein